MQKYRPVPPGQKVCSGNQMHPTELLQQWRESHLRRSSEPSNYFVAQFLPSAVRGCRHPVGLSQRVQHKAKVGWDYSCFFKTLAISYISATFFKKDSNSFSQKQIIFKKENFLILENFGRLVVKFHHQ